MRRIEVDGVEARARVLERVLVLTFTFVNLLEWLAGMTRVDVSGVGRRVGDGGARAGVGVGVGISGRVAVERS